MAELGLNEVALNVTARCGGGCRYCPVALAPRPEDPSEEDLVTIVRDAAALGARRLCLTGGEPFVAPALRALLTEAHRCELAVAISTSGVGVTTSSLASAEAAAGRVRAVEITFSIDTLDERVATDLGRPHVAAAVAALDAAKAAGWPWVPSVNLVITRLNLDDVLTVAELCREKGAGFGVQALSEGLPGGRRVPAGLAPLPGDPRLSRVARHLEQLARAGLILTNSVSYLVESTSGAGPRSCSALRDRLCVDVDLDAHTCWLLPSIGSLRVMTVAEAWGSTQAERSRAMMASGSCPDCTLRCFRDAGRR